MRIHLALLSLALVLATRAPVHANPGDKWAVLQRIAEAKAQHPKLTSANMEKVRHLSLCRIPGSTEMAVAQDGRQIGVYQPIGDIYRPLDADGTPGEPAPRPWGRLHPKVGKLSDTEAASDEGSSEESLPLVLGLAGTVCCLGLGLLLTRSRAGA